MSADCLREGRSDFWREDFRSYASQWGYEPESPVAKLIDFVRDEYRAKYGCDYLLTREGEAYRVSPGSRSDGSVSLYGESHLLADAARFGVSILPSVLNRQSLAEGGHA